MNNIQRLIIKALGIQENEIFIKEDDNSNYYFFDNEFNLYCNGEISNFLILPIINHPEDVKPYHTSYYILFDNEKQLTHIAPWELKLYMIDDVRTQHHNTTIYIENGLGLQLLGYANDNDLFRD